MIYQINNTLVSYNTSVSQAENLVTEGEVGTHEFAEDAREVDAAPL